MIKFTRERELFTEKSSRRPVHITKCHLSWRNTSSIVEVRHLVRNDAWFTHVDKNRWYVKLDIQIWLGSPIFGYI
jgi:hypothetical protein